MSDGMTGASGGGDEEESFADFQVYLDLHAKNGVILNGILTWIDIQQKTTAPLVWRNQASAWFSEPEVMEAKEALWRVCASKVDIIGKLVSRTTSDKKSVTIGDISDAMTKLKDKGVMPLLLGTSLMLQRVPCYNTTSKDDSDITSVMTRVKGLEDCMNEYMKQQTSQMENLSSSVMKISTTTAPSMNTSTTSKPAGPGTSFFQQQRERMESLGKKHKLDDEDIEVFLTPPLNPPRSTVRRNFQPSGRVAPPAFTPLQPAGIAPLPQNNQAPSYAQAMAKDTNQSGHQQPPPRPRKQSTLLFGKAKIGKDNQTQLLAANVNLVASGVSKAATDIQLKEFLEDKGIEVTEIECMTYHPDARTNTFRVAIAVADYEKALNPEVWPYRVAVRTFRPARRDREQRSMENQFGRSGGVFQNQRRNDQQQHNKQQPGQHSQQVSEGVETSNRFDALIGMDNQSN